MVAIAPLVGSFVAPVAAVVVYADATRRGLPDRARLRWALGVGVASFGGFLVPLFLGDPLVRLYLHAVKSRPVVTAPARSCCSTSPWGWRSPSERSCSTQPGVEF